MRHADKMTGSNLVQIQACWPAVVQIQTWPAVRQKIEAENGFTNATYMKPNFSTVHRTLISFAPMQFSALSTWV